MLSPGVPEIPELAAARAAGVPDHRRDGAGVAVRVEHADRDHRHQRQVDDDHADRRHDARDRPADVRGRQPGRAAGRGGHDAGRENARRLRRRGVQLPARDGEDLPARASRCCSTSPPIIWIAIPTSTRTRPPRRASSPPRPATTSRSSTWTIPLAMRASQGVASRRIGFSVVRPLPEGGYDRTTDTLVVKLPDQEPERYTNTLPWLAGSDTTRPTRWRRCSPAGSPARLPPRRAPVCSRSGRWRTGWSWSPRRAASPTTTIRRAPTSARSWRRWMVSRGRSC